MVKSANRVIRILKTVGSSKYGMSNSELSEKLNIPKGSLSLLLTELVASDFLSLREMERLYILGPQIFVLAGQYLADMDMVQFGRPIVRDMMMTTNESAALAIRKGFEILVICGENCSQPLRRSVEIGYRSPMHMTAAGKAILAHLTDEEIDQYLSSVKLESVTLKTITRQEVLLKELQSVRSERIAYCKEEQFEGLTAMAAPVFDMHGSVDAALIVTFPTIRFNVESEKLIKETLEDASEKFSRLLGFNSTSATGKHHHDDHSFHKVTDIEFVKMKG